MEYIYASEYDDDKHDGDELKFSTIYIDIYIHRKQKSFT